MSLCKHFIPNHTGNGRCTLIESDALNHYLRIRQAFCAINHREFILNGECFWKSEEMNQCPYFQPKR